MNDIIPIDSEVTTFSEYLNNNCRGILSARFGDGKSFFLNEVKKQLSNKYLFLTKLLQKREMRKDIVIELSYKGFSRASDYS